MSALPRSCILVYVFSNPLYLRVYLCIFITLTLTETRQSNLLCTRTPYGVHDAAAYYSYIMPSHWQITY